MTLYEMLDTTLYDQEVWIYETNAYGQNMPIFRGKVTEARQSEDDVWSWLMSTVELYTCTAGILVIYVKDNNYNEPLENHYMGSERWNDKNKPWKSHYEISQELKERASKC